MEKPKRPNIPSHRRLESLDVKKISSSLNMSTSSLRSINEDRETAVPASRRSTVVRFSATPRPPSPSSGTRKSPLLMSQQAKARPATARPGSSSGPKARSSFAVAGGTSEPGTKTIRKGWGSPGGAVEKEREDGDLSSARSKATTTQVRSSSVPRRISTEEKPLQKRESKIKITSSTKARPDPSPKPNVSQKPGAERSPIDARKTCEKAPSGVSVGNMVKVSPPRRISATTIGASWESLPPDLQSLGSGVMNYRDASEMAAIEALQEASAAEIVLKCLSAFAVLASSAAKQSPQQTVDEFLALQAAVTRSTAVVGDQQHGSGRAADWLHAAVNADLAPFSLYAAPPSRTASPAVPSPPTRQASGAEETRLESAARELGEEMCAWFAGYVEGLVDTDVAGTLGQLKRVNDWLDAVELRSEAVERLRKKIYGYLLDHVESAVVALNGGVAHCRRK